MDVITDKKLDLKEFGMEGEIVFAMPGQRKQHDIGNELGRCGVNVMINGEPTLKDPKLMDMVILGRLLYIKSAPFPMTVNGYLDYCDKIDAKGESTSDIFAKRLDEEIKPFNNGKVSPFAILHS